MSTAIPASPAAEVAQEVATAPDFPRCGAKLRNGRGTCKLPAGWATPHTKFGRCRLHGGNTPTQRQHAAAEEARVEAVKLVMGSPIPTAPEDALQLCIDVSVGELAYCNERIAELTDANAAVPLTSERLHQELDKHGDVHDLEERTVQSTAELHIWITTRIGATERLARFSKMALDAGVAERRVRLNERQTEMIAGAVLAVVAQLASLSDVDRARLPALLAEHVGRLAEPPLIEAGA
jgi:hypothetical protein